MKFKLGDQVILVSKNKAAEFLKGVVGRVYGFVFDESIGYDWYSVRFEKDGMTYKANVIETDLEKPPVRSISF